MTPFPQLQRTERKAAERVGRNRAFHPTSGVGKRLRERGMTFELDHGDGWMLKDASDSRNSTKRAMNLSGLNKFRGAGHSVTG